MVEVVSSLLGGVVELQLNRTGGGRSEVRVCTLEAVASPPIRPRQTSIGSPEMYSTLHPLVVANRQQFPVPLLAAHPA